MSDSTTGAELSADAELARLKADLAKAQADAAEAKLRAAEAELARKADEAARKKAAQNGSAVGAGGASVGSNGANAEAALPAADRAKKPAEQKKAAQEQTPQNRITGKVVSQPGQADAGAEKKAAEAESTQESLPANRPGSGEKKVRQQEKKFNPTDPSSPIAPPKADARPNADAEKDQPKGDKTAEHHRRNVKPGAAKSDPRAQRSAAKGESSKATGAAVPEAEIDEEVACSGYRTLFRVLGSYTFSGVVQLLVIIILAISYIEATAKDEEPEVVSAPLPQETITEVLDTRITPTERETAAESTAISTLSSQGVPNPLNAAEATLDPRHVANADPVPANPGPLAQLAGLSGTAAIKELGKEYKGDARVLADNIEDALDKLTQEILSMLQKGNVHVTWVFDESESMADDRAEIQSRIDRVYTELGAKESAQGDALSGAVVSYGSEFHIHTKIPTTNADALIKDMGKVQEDDSGNEMMCQAVQSAIELYKQYTRKTRRQTAIVLVTDESGDPKTNISHLELAINSAKDAGARIYVIGREAVFGYPYAYMRWTDPDTKIVYWLRIDRGPETPGVEALQTNGFWRRHDAHPSGFGSFEQSRMARESGGIFFMLPSPEIKLVGRDDRKYDLAKMRPYLPSLERRDFYNDEISKSKLRSTVRKVIYDLNPWNEAIARHINMRDDFSINPQELQRQAVQEMNKAKQYVLYLDAAEKAMKSIERERENVEVYPRWQANYDLIYAQILAYKVRIYQYGAFLQHWLKNPRDPALRPPKNVRPTATATHWDIVTTQRLLPTQAWTEEEQKKYIDEATRRFKKILEDHDGTPWATRAQWELVRGFGVDFRQAWDDPRRGQGVKLPKY